MAAGFQYVSIPLSGSVSDNIDLSQGRLVAVFVPVTTSADLLLRTSFDTTSANFVRAQLGETANGGDLKWATGPGSRMALMSWDYTLPAYARLELGVAQAAARSFQVLTAVR